MTTQFSNAREAKEFLVSRIVAEAKRENVALSEVERKMLYFTETAWTLPDIMEVSDEFDRQYDQAKYEKKIAHLIRNETKRLRRENPEEYASWISAARKLKKEDHYISVMVDGAGLPTGLISDIWKGGILVGTMFCLLLALNPFMSYVGLCGAGRYGSLYDGSCTENLRLSSVLGYMFVSLVVLYFCGLVYAHFDHKRRLYRLCDRILDPVCHGVDWVIREL
jgi:hypothetical protein